MSGAVCLRPGNRHCLTKAAKAPKSPPAEHTNTAARRTIKICYSINHSPFFQRRAAALLALTLCRLLLGPRQGPWRIKQQRHAGMAHAITRHATEHEPFHARARVGRHRQKRSEERRVGKEG